MHFVCFLKPWPDSLGFAGCPINWYLWSIESYNVLRLYTFASGGNLMWNTTLQSHLAATVGLLLHQIGIRGKLSIMAFLCQYSLSFLFVVSIIWIMEFKKEIYLIPCKLRLKTYCWFWKSNGYVGNSRLFINPMFSSRSVIYWDIFLSKLKYTLSLSQNL